jgi:hypothetical protein
MRDGEKRREGCSEEGSEENARLRFLGSRKRARWVVRKEGGKGGGGGGRSRNVTLGRLSRERLDGPGWRERTGGNGLAEVDFVDLKGWGWAVKMGELSRQ